MSLVSKADIVNQVRIYDLAKQFGIKLEAISAGNFDYRCRCMSPEHKMGRERTSSLYIDSIENNFHCFGCSAGASVIDFYMICLDKSFSDAFNEMKLLVKTPGTYKDVVDQKRVVFPLLIESSNIIREFLQRNPEKLNDITDLLKNVDDISFDLGKEDPEKIIKMNKQIKHMLENI